MDENIEKRLQFALSIIFLAAINLIFRLIFDAILKKFTLDEITRILVTFIAYAFIIFLSAIIIFYIINKTFLILEEDETEEEKQELVIKERTDPSLNLVFQGFTFKNFGSQLKSALILICIIYIPLDFFSYFIPLLFKLNVLEYQLNTLSSSFLGSYLLYDFNLMIIMTIIIHFFVALREEFVFRGIYITFGETKLSKSTVFIHSAFLFGLAHFSYIFTLEKGDSIFFPFWWFLNGAIIGITSAYFYISKKQLWPLIIAHWTNNVISAIVLRLNHNGVPYWQGIFLTIYVPIFALGIVLFIIYRKSLTIHIKRMYHLFINYFIETPEKAYFALDFGIIVIIWMLSII